MEALRITKWLHKSDLEWLESEKRRLEKKGWSVIIEIVNERYSLRKETSYWVSKMNSNNVPINLKDSY